MYFRKFTAIVFLLAFLTSCSRPAFDEAVKRAEEQVGLGNFREAAEIYESVIGKYPHDSRIAAVLLQLGNLYAAIGDDDQAFNAYQRCIEAEPTSEAARFAHEKRAELYGREDRWGGMVEEYTALLKYFPDHPDVQEYRMRLGEAYITGRQYQQARTELRSFVEKEKVSPELRQRALFDIGETYFLEGKPGKAVRFYYALTQEAPKSKVAPEAELRIATCLEEMGYLGTAHKFAEEAKKTYPNKEVVEDRMKGMEKRSKSNNQVKKRKTTE
jgi:TolA-binding protein